MSFAEAWARVGGLEGEAFRTKTGDEFSYRFKKTFVVVSPGEQSIPRTNFEKVFKDPGRIVQGSTHILSVLESPRVTST